MANLALAVCMLTTLIAAGILPNTDAQCTGDTDIVLGEGVTTLNSDNYPVNYEDYTHCRWFISSPAGTRIKFAFDDVFDVEGPSEGRTDCHNDAVTVFDTRRPGSDEAVRKLARCSVNVPFPYNKDTLTACGSAAPTSFKVGRNTAVVQFCSDWTTAGKGWKLDLSYEQIPETPPWETPTITLTTLGAKQTVSSPAFPNSYPEDYVAEYIIRNTRKDKPVHLKKNSIDLGPLTTCEDKLTILDVTNSKTYTICGTEVTGPGTERHVEELEVLEFLNTEEIRIMFTTDSYDVYKGFSFDVTIEQCPRNQYACDTVDGCYTFSQACDKEQHCGDDSDEKWEYCAPECGKPHFPLKETNTGRIVGGQFVNRHSLPWQVAAGGCGGTIISDEWVLSAAHCFDDATAEPGQTLGSLRFGTHDKAKTDEDNLGVTIDYVKSIRHPYYGNTEIGLDYDYCLLKTATKIPFRKNILPACLPPHGSDPVKDKQCMTSGWGNTQTVRTGLLKQVYLDVVSREDCRQYWSVGEISDQMICAGPYEGKIGSCHGDSGGPFICKNSDGRWNVEGIVSWGSNPCAQAAKPPLFARTGAVTNWIVDTVATN